MFPNFLANFVPVQYFEGFVFFPTSFQFAYLQGFAHFSFVQMWHYGDSSWTYPLKRSTEIFSVFRFCLNKYTGPHHQTGLTSRKSFGHKFCNIWIYEITKKIDRLKSIIWIAAFQSKDAAYGRTSIRCRPSQTIILQLNHFQNKFADLQLCSVNVGMCKLGRIAEIAQ